MTELFILLTIGVEKYQEKMRENVGKENSRRFPLNFELSVASRQLLLSGREGKKSQEINKNKFKSKILIFWSKTDNIKVTNENIVKTKQVKNPHNDLCGNNAWERNTEMKIASGIVQMLDGIDDEFARSVASLDFVNYDW